MSIKNLATESINLSLDPKLLNSTISYSENTERRYELKCGIIKTRHVQGVLLNVYCFFDDGSTMQ